MTKPNDNQESNFPSGFNNGVSIRNVPILNTHSGKVFWVNSNGGANITGAGTRTRPLATIAGALAYCKADRGDIIICKSGHAENIIAAGTLNVNISGVSIIGLGQGADRPTLTFNTATTASVTVTANNVTIQNIVGLTGLNALVNPFNVTAADCYLDIEWQDPTTILEAVSCVLASAAAKRLMLKLKYKGQTGGSSCVTPIKLVGVPTARINVDFVGKASTAVVDFATTACTDIVVNGYIYNASVTDGSKDIVDTVTGSTWYGLISDGSAGGTFGGGSAVAWGIVDDSSSIVPAQNSTANTYAGQVIGNKTDAAADVLGTTKSLVAYAKGSIDIGEKAAVSSQVGVLVNGMTLFTVAGGPILITGLVSIALTANSAVGTTLQYENITTLGTLTGTISGASASLTGIAAGTTVSMVGTALTTALNIGTAGVALGQTVPILCQAGTINGVVATAGTGTFAHYIRYKPLAPGVTVTG